MTLNKDELERAKKDFHDRFGHAYAELEPKAFRDYAEGYAKAKALYETRIQNAEKIINFIANLELCERDFIDVDTKSIVDAFKLMTQLAKKYLATKNNNLKL